MCKAERPLNSKKELPPFAPATPETIRKLCKVMGFNQNTYMEHFTRMPTEQEAQGMIDERG